MSLPNPVSPADAAALERKRALLAAKLERHAARLSRIAAGHASPATVRAVHNMRPLSQVLAGPVAVLNCKSARRS